MFLKFAGYLIFAALVFLLGRLSTCNNLEEVADQIKKILAFSLLILEEVCLRLWGTIFK